ncbi:hypothetical protein TJA_23350 [Thermus sp. LT1-2-5]|uniref:hypothetical protein n=1 Tax=Thermus sp. LT1-2-5 TaxID=3026935 RepID=UPI0030E9FFE6
MGERLTYHTWQVQAARLRLLGGSLGLLFLLWLALVGGGFLSLLSLAGVVLGGFYLLRTAWEPLKRAGLSLELVPEGVRVRRALYPKEAFQGVEGPLGPWTWLETRPTGLQRYRLHLAPPWQGGPLFRLRFREAHLPLPLDLPGWDRLLAHLGLFWRDHPGLLQYLTTATGPAWLNGLLHPPEEVLAGWAEARRRYRQAWAWLWLGLGLLGVGFLGAYRLALEGLSRLEEENVALDPWPLVLFLGLGFLGLLVAGGVFLIHFNVGRGRPGWVVAYNPLREGGPREGKG